MTNSERRVGARAPGARRRPARRCPTGRSSPRVGARARPSATRSPGRPPPRSSTSSPRRPRAGSCDLTGLSHERLRREGALQWPCPAAAPTATSTTGTERLYAARRFPTPDGRARFAPTPHAAPADAPDADFPLVLTTGRVADQWHTMTRTGKSRDAARAPSRSRSSSCTPPTPSAPGVARRRARRGCVSRRGERALRARVDETRAARASRSRRSTGARCTLAPGAGHAQRASTHGALDPVSRQPELKARAVRVEPVARDRAARAPRRRRAARLVVVGAGMAGLATVEALLAHGGRRRLARDDASARSPSRPTTASCCRKLLAGAVGAAELELRPPAWFAERGVDCARRRRSRALDLDARARVELTDGERLAYDALVLATGSRPFVPPIPGVDRRGVHAFRTLRRRARDRSARGRGAPRGRDRRRAARARGGARAARARLRVTVVAPRRPADGAAARRRRRRAARARAARRSGIDVRCGAQRPSGSRQRRVERSCSPTASELDADLVVVATGIRPDVGARPRGRARGRARRSSSTTSCARARRACGRSASAPSTAASSTGCGRRCSSRRGAPARRWPARPAAFHGAVPGDDAEGRRASTCSAAAARARRTATRRCSRSTPGAAATASSSLRGRPPRRRRSCSATCARRRAAPLLADGEPVPAELLDTGPPTGRGGDGRPGAQRLLLQGRHAGRDRRRDPRAAADHRRAGRRAHARDDRLRRLPRRRRGAARPSRVGPLGRRQRPRRDALHDAAECRDRVDVGMTTVLVNADVAPALEAASW